MGFDIRECPFISRRGIMLYFLDLETSSKFDYGKLEIVRKWGILFIKEL